MLAGAARDGRRGRRRAASTATVPSDGPLPVEHVLVVGADGAPALPKTDGVRWHDFAAARRRAGARRRGDRGAQTGADGAVPALLHLRLDRRAERRPAPLRRADPRGDDGGRAPRPRPRRHDLHPHPARPPDRAALRDVAELRARLDPGDPGRLGRRTAAPARCASGTAPSCRRRRRSSPTSSAWSSRARRRRRRRCGSSSSPAPRCRGRSPSGRPPCSPPRSAAPGARPSPASARSPPPATTRRRSGAPTAARWPAPGSASSTTPTSCSAPARRATSRSPRAASSRSTSTVPT